MATMDMKHRLWFELCYEYHIFLIHLNVGGMVAFKILVSNWNKNVIYTKYDPIVPANSCVCVNCWECCRSALIWAGAVAGIKEMFPPNIIHQATTKSYLVKFLDYRCLPCLPGWLLGSSGRLSDLTPVTRWENRWTGGELKWHILLNPGISWHYGFLLRSRHHDVTGGWHCVVSARAVYWDQDMRRAAPGNKTYFLPPSLSQDKTQSQLGR